MKALYTYLFVLCVFCEYLYSQVAICKTSVLVDLGIYYSCNKNAMLLGTKRPENT